MDQVLRSVNDICAVNEMLTFGRFLWHLKTLRIFNALDLREGLYKASELKFSKYLNTTLSKNCLFEAKIQLYRYSFLLKIEIGAKFSSSCMNSPYI